MFEELPIHHRKMTQKNEQETSVPFDRKNERKKEMEREDLFFREDRYETRGFLGTFIDS